MDKHFQEICKLVSEGLVTVEELSPEIRSSVAKHLDAQLQATLAQDPFAMAAAKGVEFRPGSKSFPRECARMSWPFNEVKVEKAQPRRFPF